MNQELKYVPILRSRDQEESVLKSFDFGDEIYPYIEIIRELKRKPREPKSDGKAKPKKEKTFQSVYTDLIKSINASAVFIDLPVHLAVSSGMKKETVTFLRIVVGNRQIRTEYIGKLAGLNSMVIPVISTYYERTGERDSIVLQANDLRPDFDRLAFRTFSNSFKRDLPQLQQVLRSSDFLIMDWEEDWPSEIDEDHKNIINALKTLKGTIIIHRNPIPQVIKYKELVHGEIVDSIDNRMMGAYSEFNGKAFSDYCGIKKGTISDGGTISPGFLYYDAAWNKFFGYKGQKLDLDEFAGTIVPAVIKSDASRRMADDERAYLDEKNNGWQILNDIFEAKTSGRSAAKFKKIGMLHYLHCVKCKIENGDFDSL